MGVRVRRGRWAEVRLAGFDGVDSEVRIVAQRAENMFGKIVFGVDVRKPGNPVDNVIVLWETKTNKQEGNMCWNNAFQGHV
jgi:hypothetical protein